MFTQVLQRLCRSIDFVVMLAGYFASFLMPFLAAIVAYEVFSRYFLNHPTIWAFDLSLFLFGYIAALGGAYAQQKKAHINVDILYLKVSPHTRRVFNLFSYSLAIFFLVLVVKLGFEKYEEAIEFDYRTQSEWAPPMFHFWIMMCVASVLFIAQFGRDMVAEIYHLVTGNPLIALENDDNDEY